MADAAPKDWKSVAKEAQDYRDRSIAAVQPAISDLPAELPRDVSGLPRLLLTDHEIWITQSSPEDLVELLSRGQLSSTSVTKSFLRRAALAQKVVRT
jgi:amidase